MTRPNTMIRALAASALVLGASLTGAALASPAGAAVSARGPHAVALSARGFGTAPAKAATSWPAPTSPRGSAAPFRKAPEVTPTGATMFMVTTTADSPLATPSGTACVDAADGSCSLRAAVQAADNLGTPVVVVLQSADYALTDGTDGTLAVTDSAGITIEGVGEGYTAIDASALSGDGDFEIGSSPSGPGVLTLDGLTVTGGTAGTGGAIDDDESNGVVSLVDSAVVDSQATNGGAIFCDDGDVFLQGSSLQGDTATEDGGGIYEDWCNVWLSDSVVSNDAANGSVLTDDNGGGIYAEYGLIHAMSTAFNGDVAGSDTVFGSGGGIANVYAGVTLLGSTFNGDQALDGGGGGISSVLGDTTATATSFVGDTADGADSNGAAISLNEGDVVDLHDVTILRDDSSNTEDVGAGGAIYVASDDEPSTLLVDDHSQIIGNGSGGIVGYTDAGGYKIEVSDSTLAGDSSGATTGVTGAGGIYAYAEDGGAQVSLPGDIFFGDSDPLSFAAGAVLVEADEDAGVALDVASGNFDANSSAGEHGAGGVAMQCESDDDSCTGSVDDSVMFDNSAPDAGFGGAIQAYNDDSNMSLQLAGDDLYGNSVGSTASGEGGAGGAVFVGYYANLVVTSTTILGNVAFAPSADGGEGGGIYYDGELTADLSHVYLYGNHATGGEGEGGAIYAFPYYGALNLADSTVSRNFAIYGAGLLIGEDQDTITQSTISGNVAGSSFVAGEGGGLYNDAGHISVENSTVSGNTAVGPGGGEGGGLFMDSGYTDLYFSTVSGNAAAFGGATYDEDTGSSGTTLNSILEGTCDGPLLVSLGGNVLGTAGCVDAKAVRDVVTSNAGLRPLAAYGGPTATIALRPTSPAIGLAVGTCLPNDQRGAKRPAMHCDSGAFEH